MFDRRGEDFGSWPRTEKGAGREMQNQPPDGRDIGRDGTDQSGIREEPGEWNGPQTPYEVARPFDPRNGSGGNAMVESEKEDSARSSFEASSSSLNSEKAHVSSLACPFMEGVDNI